jgi:hypothetical protein
MISTRKIRQYQRYRHRRFGQNNADGIHSGHDAEISATRSFSPQAKTQRLTTVYFDKDRGQNST